MVVTRKKVVEALDKRIDLQRASRLKYVRSLAFLSRLKLSELTGYTQRSHLAWEEGESPINEKAVLKIIYALEKLNIKCSYEWLMNGVGDPPQRIENLQKLILENALVEADDQLAFETDIMLFKKRYPDSIVLEIRDDRAVPKYYRGDFLFAPRISKEQFKNHWPMGYLFEIEPSVFFPAMITKNTENLYSVESFHKDPKEKTLSNKIELEHFYPIVTVKRNFFSAY